ncbi:MAG: hypothetical protein EFT35_04140 [Methanophagales archaeon ANME-1-THS]|nr:MAG: hypothetical protein EFT35_04140 [Methanophagales archaeon ANME-1-THS]
MFTAPAAAGNYFYFVPQNSSCSPGESVLVSVVVHVESTPTDNQIGCAQVHIDFNPSVVNITKIVEPIDKNDWDLWNWKHMGNYVFFGGNEFGGFGPGEIYLGNMTLTGISPGVSPIEVSHFYPQTPDPTLIGDKLGNNVPVSAVNGTFTCIAPPETFTKDLVTGWNLISLPLTNATNMTVANIMSSVSGSYEYYNRYNAVTKSWVSMSSSDTMSNGIGYFINMTSAGTWKYTGSAYTSMNVNLSQGLNMVGWLNCSKNVTDALSSLDGKYNYVARFNATSKKFEVYNPHAPTVFNDFTTMDRGEGYFISMKEAATLTKSC